MRSRVGILGRLLVIAGGGLTGAIAIGLLAPTPALLVLGILGLGASMIAAILFYLFRPVPRADLEPGFGGQEDESIGAMQTPESSVLPPRPAWPPQRRDHRLPAQPGKLIRWARV